MCEQGWLRRAKGSRIVQVTLTGEVEITSRLGVYFLDLRAEERLALGCVGLFECEVMLGAPG